MPVRGVTATANAFRNYSKHIQEDIQDAVEEVTLMIERQAIADAPTSGEPLITTYGQQKNNTNLGAYVFSKIKNQGYTGEIYIDGQGSLLSIYVNFGTGQSAAGFVPTLPADFQNIARKYYINGKGTLIKKPYFLNSYFENSPKLITKVKSILRNTKL